MPFIEIKLSKSHLVNPGSIPGLDPFPSRIMTNLNSEEGTNFFFFHGPFFRCILSFLNPRSTALSYLSGWQVHKRPAQEKNGIRNLRILSRSLYSLRRFCDTNIFNAESDRERDGGFTGGEHLLS